MQVPAPFEYERATTVDHALQLLTDLGTEARALAGGHSLLPMMKLRLAQPEHLIDINDLSELDFIRADGDVLRIGALTRHAALLSSDVIAEHAPIVIDAERVIADPVVRNRGTIGGSLCQADPSEDLLTVSQALGAELVVRSLDGERVVAIDDFYRGPYETAVASHELLTEIRIPLRPHAGSAYEKVERRVGDWAIAAAGVAVWLEDGRIADARVALTAVGLDDRCAEDAQASLRGQAPNQEAIAEAARLAAQACDPASDQRGSAEYKRHLAGELTGRALRTACERALAA